MRWECGRTRGSEIVDMKRGWLGGLGMERHDPSYKSWLTLSNEIGYKFSEPVANIIQIIIVYNMCY